MTRPKCPKCSHEYGDPWNLFEIDHDAHKDEESMAMCKGCMAPFLIERIVTVEYRNKVAKR